MMQEKFTERLKLHPFNRLDFDLFVNQMLTDAKVIQFFYSYQQLKDVEAIRSKAETDFWEHFEESRLEHDLEIWAARTKEGNDFVGWSGLLHTDLSDQYGGPELQYMLARGAHGQGYATELASAVVQYAEDERKLTSIMATVDIPNVASIRVLEKIGFKNEGQIEAYGSTEMFLFRKRLRS